MKNLLNNILKIVVKKIKQYFIAEDSKKNKWIFLPSTHFIMFWDILGLLFHLIMLWVSPFLCSFKEINNSIIKSL